MSKMVRSAIICVMSLFIFGGCSSNPAVVPTETPTATGVGTPVPSPAVTARPTPAAVSAPSIVFDHLQFIDERHGWVASRDQFGAEVTGLWSTEDGGGNWRKNSVPSVYGAAFLFSDAANGWLAGYDNCKIIDGVYQCGKLIVYKTNDAGAHWIEQWSVSLVAAGLTPIRIESSGVIDAVLIADGKLFMTGDGGSNWQQALMKNRSFQAELASYRSKEDVWVVGHNNVKCGKTCELQFWHSTDKGHSWKQSGKLPASDNTAPIGFTFFDGKRGGLFISDYEVLQGYLFVSQDEGKSWQQAMEQLRGGRPYPRDLIWSGPQTLWIPLSVGAGPIEGGLLRSMNGGKHFDIVTPSSMSSVEEAFFLSDKQGWIITNGAGDNPLGKRIMATRDGTVSWQEVTPR